MDNPGRLREFVRAFTALVEAAAGDERRIFAEGKALLAQLIAHDDIHRVSNALADRPSVSIHVYGANIGAVKRHVYEMPDGRPREFVSGYSSDVMPNFWDRSKESRAA